MKRLISLLLCLLLVMSMTITAFAENDDINNAPVEYAKVDLTITGHASGHTYVAYQIFKGNAAVKDGKDILANVAWGSAISNPDTLIEVLKSDTTPIINSTNTNQGTTLAKEFENAASTAEGIANVMTSWGDDLDRIKYFANLLYYGVYKDDEGAKSADLLNKREGVKSTTVEGSKIYTFKGLESGYYLIMDANDYADGKLNDYRTNFIITVTSNTDVHVKGSIPTVTKQASNSLTGPYTDYISNQIGEPYHYYEWTGSIVSDVSQYKYYEYGFEDTLSAGLTFNQIEQVLIKTVSEDYVIFTRDADGKPVDGNGNRLYEVGEEGANDEGAKLIPFTFSKTEKENGETVITLSFEDLKHTYPTLLKSDSVVVRYSAALNTNAVIAEDGNPNSVILHYANNPHGEGTGKTESSEARVYTFGMKLTKVNETGSPLEGAHFVLAHLHSHGTNVYPVYAKVDFAKKTVTVKNEDGTETTEEVDDKSKGVITGWTTALAQASTLISNAQGLIEIEGLKDTTDYYLSETKAPEGYNQLMGNTEIQITGFTVDNTDHKVTSLTYEINDAPTTKSTIDEDNTNDDLIVTLSVTNKSGTVLPSTGGMGTTLIYAAGALLVLVAVVMLITKKRVADAE